MGKVEGVPVRGLVALDEHLTARPEEGGRLAAVLVHRVPDLQSFIEKSEKKYIF
jgi:hypothetical protein